MRLIFLDIDGVLNTHDALDPEVLCGQIHPDKVMLLNGILRAADAKIVLSSAWRYIVHRGEATIQGMDWLLRSHGVLSGRLIGVTREDTMQTANERGDQITDWLSARSGIEGHVVLDDMDLGISIAGHPFVMTDSAVGLRIEDAARAIELLGGTT